MKKISLCLTFFGMISTLSLHAQAVNLEGNWQWTQTKNMSKIKTANETPESCSCTKSIEFHESGILYQFSNGEMVDSSSYEIKKIEFMNDPIKYQLRSKLLKGEIKFLSDDKIGIGAWGACGIINYYQRATI